jgi:hypothetical protein
MDMKPMTQDNEYYCCEAVVSALNKVLENFIEVVTWLEHQSDTRFHILHVANIKVRH